MAWGWGLEEASGNIVTLSPFSVLLISTVYLYFPLKTVEPYEFQHENLIHVTVTAEREVTEKDSLESEAMGRLTLSGPSVFWSQKFGLLSGTLCEWVHCTSGSECLALIIQQWGLILAVCLSGRSFLLTEAFLLTSFMDGSCFSVLYWLAYLPSITMSINCSKPEPALMVAALWTGGCISVLLWSLKY